MDLFARYTLAPGATPPHDFDSSADRFLIIEHESRRLAVNLKKHIDYIDAVFNEYYNKLKNNLFLNFFIIYGPNIRPKKNIQTNFGSFYFIPNLIFLSEIKKDAFLPTIKEKVVNKIKLTRLEQLIILFLPEITKDYFNTLLEIDEFITNTNICSLKFAKDSSVLLQNLYNHHLSAEQQQWLKERTKMGNLVAMIREEWTRETQREAMLEGKAEGIAETEIKMALKACRRAKSVKDFPAIVENLRSIELAEDNIKTALNQVRAEFKKKSRT
jgi:hypothetical protein